MRKIKLAVIQYKTHYLNVDKNLLKIERILKKCVFFRPNLVVFPEYSLTGPLYGHYYLAFNKKSNTIEKIATLAKKYKTDIAIGSFVRKQNNKKYNSSCIITSDGKIHEYYDKQKLWTAERVHLNPGKKSKIYNLDIGKISLQICADLHSSKISNDYRKTKPDIIINSSMWSIEDSHSSTKLVPHNIELIQTEILARARAIENRSYFIFCNFADQLKIRAKSNREYTETSTGNTMVINPYGEIIAKTSGNKEEILLAEIDISKCHWSKYNY